MDKFMKIRIFLYNNINFQVKEVIKIKIIILNEIEQS